MRFTVRHDLLPADRKRFGHFAIDLRPAGPLWHPSPRPFVVQTTAYAILHALNHLALAIHEKSEAEIFAILRTR